MTAMEMAGRSDSGGRGDGAGNRLAQRAIEPLMASYPLRADAARQPMKRGAQQTDGHGAGEIEATDEELASVLALDVDDAGKAIAIDQRHGVIVATLVYRL